MNRNQRSVHLISLLAILVGLFGPVLSLPVLADDPPPAPDAVLQATPLSDTPQPGIVTPVIPTLVDAACTEGIVFAQVPVEVSTEGIIYSIGAPDAAGEFVITATLEDASAYAFATGLEGWAIDGPTATATGTVDLCPTLESEAPATLQGQIDSPSTPDAPGEPTIGRGPARDSSMMRGMNIMATSNELEISKSAFPATDVTAGTTIAYTITVMNNTDSDQHYSFTDNLPEGVTFDSATVPYPLHGDSCAYDSTAHQVECSVDASMTLYQGWVDEWIIAVTVDDDAATESNCATGLINTVTGNWGGTASANSRLRLSDCTPGLSLSVVIHTPEITRRDQPISFSLIATNTSEFAATDVNLYALFVSAPLGNLGTVTIDHTSETGICGPGVGNAVGCSSITVPGRVGDQPGVTTLTITSGNYPISATTCDGPELFEAYLYHSSMPVDPPGVRQDFEITFTCEALLELEIAADKTVLDPNETLSLTATVTNVGLAPAEVGSLFNLTFPDVPGVTGFTDAVGLDCSGDVFPLVIDCGLASALAPGSSASFQFSFAGNLDMCESGLQGTVVQHLSDSWEWVNTALIPNVLVDCGLGSLEFTGFEVNVSQTPLGMSLEYSVTITNVGEETYTEPIIWMFTLPQGSIIHPEDESGCQMGQASESPTITCISTSPGITPRGQVTAFTEVLLPWQYVPLHCGTSGALTAQLTTEVVGQGEAWNPARRTASTIAEIPCISEYLLTVSADKEVVNPGDSFTYTYDVRSINGVTPPWNFSFVHNPVLPEMVQEQDISWAHCYMNPAGVEGQCFSMIGPADEPRISFTHTTANSFTNDVCISGFTTTATLGSGAWLESTSAHTLSAKVDANCQLLSLAMDSSVESVPAGDPFSYTVSVTNNGRNAYGSYSFDLLLPLGVELVTPDSIDSDHGTCTPIRNGSGSFTITCTSDSSPAIGGTAAHDYTFNVRSSVPPGLTICGHAHAVAVGTSGEWSGANPADKNVIIECRPVLTLVAGADIISKEPGESAIYTVIVGNVGLAEASDIEITDTLPAGFVFDPETSDDTCDLNDEGDVVCTVPGPIGRGGSAILYIGVTITTAPTAAICDEPAENTAAITDHTSATGFLMAGDLPSSESRFDIECRHELQFSKLPIQSQITQGDPIGYEITLKNTGNIDITTATISDALPELPGSAIWTVTLDDEPFDFEADVLAIPPGEERIIRIVSSEIPADIQINDPEWCVNWENSAEVSATFSNGATDSQTRPATVRVNCTGISVVQQVSSPVIEPGGEVEYTITVSNFGVTRIWTAVTAHDATETGTIFSNWSVTSDGAQNCELNQDGSPACTHESLDPGETLELTITADAPLVPTLEQCEPVSSVATLQFAMVEIVPIFDLIDVRGEPIARQTHLQSDPVTTQINCDPAVEISKDSVIETGPDGRVDAGDAITYTITVANTGNMTIYGIAVTDEMSAIEWDGALTSDELGPGESFDVSGTYVVTQADIDAGQLENNASVEASLVPPEDDADAARETMFAFAQSDDPEEFPESVSDTVTELTQLVQEPDIDLEKASDADGDLALDQTVTYSFVVTNTGNVTLTGLELVDALEGVEFGSTTIPDLAPEESAELTATYIVVQSDVEAGKVENCAEVTAIAPDESVVNDEDCIADPVAPNPATPQPKPDPTVAVTKLPETGSGGINSVTPILWIAAVCGIALVGMGGTGLRKRT